MIKSIRVPEISLGQRLRTDAEVFERRLFASIGVTPTESRLLAGLEKKRRELFRRLEAESGTASQPGRVRELIDY